MTYEEAEALQGSVRRFKAADNRLGTKSYAGPGENPQLVADAKEYLETRRALQALLERLET